MDNKRSPIDAEALHAILDEVIYGLQDGSMKDKSAKEISNAAGKKIALVKAQLDYANMWGGKIEIPFLGTGGVISIDDEKISKKKLGM